MIKQGIKMKESNTAFLLILITTDLHVGILSSPFSDPSPFLLFLILWLLFTHLTLSFGNFWFTILWHHLMKSQKRCRKSQQHIFLKWSIWSRTNALTSPLLGQARAGSRRAGTECTDTAKGNAALKCLGRSAQEGVRQNRKVCSDRLKAPSRLLNGLVWETVGRPEGSIWPVRPTPLHSSEGLGQAWRCLQPDIDGEFANSQWSARGQQTHSAG